MTAVDRDTSRLAELHFAPTSRAAAALVAEGVPQSRVHVTGNTGIDAVLYVRDALEAGTLPAADWSCSAESPNSRGICAYEG